MNTETPSRGVKIRDTACLVVGLAGIGYMTVVGPVSIPLLIGCLVLTGAPGVWQALALFRQWPTGSSSFPAPPVESPTDSGHSSTRSDSGDGG